MQWSQVPREVLLPEAVTHVAAGYGHTLFLTESSSVWAVGSNSRGQLGLGMRDKRASLPRRLQALIGAQTMVYCMNMQECWANKLRSAPSWQNRSMDWAGCNITAIAAGAHHSLAVSSDGELFSWGSGLRGCSGEDGSLPYTCQGHSY